MLGSSDLSDASANVRIGGLFSIYRYIHRYISRSAANKHVLGYTDIYNPERVCFYISTLNPSASEGNTNVCYLYV